MQCPQCLSTISDRDSARLSIVLGGGSIRYMTKQRVAQMLLDCGHHVDVFADRTTDPDRMAYKLLDRVSAA